MNKQKTWVNPFKSKMDHTKKQKSEINNNNEISNINGKSRIVAKHGHNTKAWNVQPIVNYPTALKSCLKINDKSKGGKCPHIYSMAVAFFLWHIFSINFLIPHSLSLCSSKRLFENFGTRSFAQNCKERSMCDGWFAEKSCGWFEIIG